VTSASFNGPNETQNAAFPPDLNRGQEGKTGLGGGARLRAGGNIPDKVPTAANSGGKLKKLNGSVNGWGGGGQQVNLKEGGKGNLQYPKERYTSGEIGGEGLEGNGAKSKKKGKTWRVRARASHSFR